ncbi:MAG TPA: MATE family efflux transporter [bacterium]|nr:MATE family efflux transporter [bacterium]
MGAMLDPLERAEALPAVDIPRKPDSRLQGLWTTLRDAVRGASLDYTTAPIRRSIVMLAVPMVLEMVMESIFALADVFWVARLGADAVATVGLTESMLTLIYTVAMGVSIGAMAMVARRVGERDLDGAARAAVQAIGLAVLISLIIGTVGGRYAPDLLAVMGGSPAVIAQGSTFTRIMLGGNATILLLFVINAVFRGAGDAAIAMRVLWFGNAINIVLGPLFIFGVGPFPELGVTGAAVATNIGRGTAVAYQLLTLARGRGRVAITTRHVGLDLRTMLSMLRLSGSAAFQVLIGTASYVGLVRIVATFGSAALAGYTIAIRLIIFALLPSWGISNAAATMVGQNLGAGKPERAERAVWQAAFYNMVFLGVIGLVFLALAPQIIGLFSGDPAVQRYGIPGLRIISGGFLFYAYGMVLTQSFNGAGDTWTPTVINIFVFWLFEIPLAYALATRIGLGPLGVFAALAVSYSILAIVSIIVFRRGRWKQKAV